jgi:hypothetical protein
LVIELNGITIEIPYDLLAWLNITRSLVVEIVKTPGTFGAEGDETGMMYFVQIKVIADDAEIRNLPSKITISVSLEDFDLEGVNTYRIVAILDDGTIIGGRYDAETGLFIFETEITGNFTISYVEDLNRIIVQIGSNVIRDLAENAATQWMDTVPVIIDGRTVLPMRFLAYSLGADVGWNDATREVSLALDGGILTFRLGELTPELAALGMEVPPQIIEGRTMVPLRFIMEFFGALVEWDDATRTIEIIR